MLRADEYGGDEDFSWVLRGCCSSRLRGLEPRHRGPEPRRCAPSQRRPENIHVCGVRVKKRRSLLGVR